MQVRQALKPYLQNSINQGVSEFPDEEEETNIMQQLYNDVNDLYIDEHRIMAQADLLEQMYNMLHEINMVARDEQIIMLKRHREVDSAELMDPDKFPIQRLSSDLIKEYESVWETKKGKRMLNEIEKYVGHSLEVKESSIDHHLSGKGVFLSCKRQNVVLPGTLLGLFPGIISDSNMPRPPTPKRGLRPYLLRSDGYWIDY